ncbi:MAG: HD-GYP domain-containing protein [Thermoleophilaceae bacterium]|nr:HD-GYP domain-containing protein [Thermoleophilaceae bacterium]
MIQREFQRDSLKVSLVAAWLAAIVAQLTEQQVFGPVAWNDWATIAVCLSAAAVAALVPWRRLSPPWVATMAYLAIFAIALTSQTGGPAGVTAFLFIPALIAAIFFWREPLALALVIVPCFAAVILIPLAYGDSADVREAVFTAPLLPAVALLLGALFNATRGSSREQLRMRGTVTALLVSLEARDGYTATHSSEVLDFVRAVASRLRLNEHDEQVASYVGLLHDVGKIAIPNEILNKEGPLDADEWEVMRQHPVIGEEILREVPGFDDVAKAVRHEHERWDGNGYPDAISGDEIPMASRIVLTCDAFHAMTSDRPYRKSIGHQAACAELVRCAGTQFDPAVVNALLAELEDRKDRSVRTANKRARQVLADAGSTSSWGSAMTRRGLTPAPRLGEL